VEKLGYPFNVRYAKAIDELMLFIVEIIRQPGLLYRHSAAFLPVNLFGK
jgi:hypothetical protein